MTSKNRIMIFGPKDDGDGEVLVISHPFRTEAHAIRHFQSAVIYSRGGTGLASVARVAPAPTI